MFRLIKAELYKSNRLGTYILNALIVCGVFLTAYFVGEASGNVNGLIYVIAERGIGMVSLLLLVYVPFFFEDNKYDTLKNVGASSFSRTEIYLGKFITQIILGIISAVIGVLALILAISIFDIGGPNQWESLSLLIEKLITAIPVYIGCLAMYDMVIIIFKREGIAILTCFIVNQSIQAICMALAYYFGGVFKKTLEYVLNIPLVALVSSPELTSEAINRCLIGGVINTAIFLLIGLFIFNKRDIK